MKTLKEVQDAIASSKKGHTSTPPEEILRRCLAKRKIHEKRHSIPEPEELMLTEAVRNKALAIACSEEAKVKYLRRQPIAHMRYDENGKEEYFFQVGAPKMTLIAFKENGQIFVGWSKRDDTKIPSVVNVVGKPVRYQAVEPVNFSKRNARYVAVLRALTDVINLNGRSATNKDGVPLPSGLGRHIEPFVGRAKKWFKVDVVANVDIQ